jgi:hypothetical protein
MKLEPTSVVFDDLTKLYERKARAKVASELRTLKANEKKLKLLEKKFKEEVAKEVIKRTHRLKNIEVENKALKQREKDIKLAEARVKEDIKNLDKVLNQTVKNAISWKRTEGYGHYRNNTKTRRSAAVDRIRNKKK